MFLMQRGEEVTLGHDGVTHKFSTKRFEHFTKDHVAAAVADMRARFPGEEEAIARYEARLLAIL